MIYKYLTTAQAFYFSVKGASYERHVDEATSQRGAACFSYGTGNTRVQQPSLKWNGVASKFECIRQRNRWDSADIFLFSAPTFFRRPLAAIRTQMAAVTDGIVRTTPEEIAK